MTEIDKVRKDVLRATYKSIPEEMVLFAESYDGQSYRVCWQMEDRSKCVTVEVRNINNPKSVAVVAIY